MSALVVLVAMVSMPLPVLATRVGRAILSVVASEVRRGDWVIGVGWVVEVEVLESAIGVVQSHRHRHFLRHDSYVEIRRRCGTPTVCGSCADGTSRTKFHIERT